VLLSYLDRYLGEYVRSMETRWLVGENDIEEFIKAKRLREKTIRDHVHYLRLALSDLNWTLEPEGVRELLAGLREEGEEHVLRHVTVALKSFLKNVLKPKDPALFRLLYDSFTVYKPRNNGRVGPPSLEQLQAIWRRLPSVESRFYFALLAEAGLRPGEPLAPSLHWLLWLDSWNRPRASTAGLCSKLALAFLMKSSRRWVMFHGMVEFDLPSYSLQSNLFPQIPPNSLCSCFWR